MGLASVDISRMISVHLFVEIFSNYFLYFITAAVLIFGFLFIVFKKMVTAVLCRILRCIPGGVFAFILIVVLGFLSSVITAIIAALLLVEILNCAPLKRQQNMNLNIIACFSIGLGAVLTPVGEPLATVVISKLDADFLFVPLAREIHSSGHRGYGYNRFRLYDY